jgi:RNA recognition motif. (a.k.a. RRM, RBD, or RNP domain)
VFGALADLRTESDVEQKLLWPLVTSPIPTGFGLHPSDVITKPNIRRLEIDKGSSRKLYFPDYVVVLAGLPLIVVEAKARGESIHQALREARLYGSELNALFPASINPCIRVIACTGDELASAPIDTAESDLLIKHPELSVGNPEFARLIDLCQRTSLQEHVDRIRRTLGKHPFKRPANLVGGAAFRNQELPPNTFGATIAGDYRHVFNPQTLEERAVVVRGAYIPSLRRQRYIEPIDRLIRGVVMPSTTGLSVLADTGDPREITAVLRERRALENQVLLLIGSVGVGKSTFVDYLSVVALPEDIKTRTIWIRLNLNDAPLSPAVAYTWIASGIISDFYRQFPDQDFDSLENLEKIFAPELNALRKGPLAILEPASQEYRARLADYLIKAKADLIMLAQCLGRYLCAGPGKLLIVVLDNCDKRTRDEQLTMFQIAHWVQNEFRSLVILPLRDETYDLHRHEPPLDTALKSLIFRVEPPQFTEVLQARVRLALQQMHSRAGSAKSLSYLLPNGIRVTYPASDQALYLASILKSLYAHDRFVRQVMTGLAGRDVRRALEIFLDFCTSGHISEDEIYKIRFFEGEYVLPLSLVARVLLRMHRRLYDGDRGYLKNLLQCSPADPLPDHFVRLSILRWLEKRQRLKGPAGVAGFHRVENLVLDLVQIGHDSARIREELLYLVREKCIVPEHLRLDSVSEDDLIRLSASGLVHLQLMANADYLAACSEDTWISDQALARRIAKRISEKGLRGHFSRATTAANAREFVEYLGERAVERVACPDAYLERSNALELNTLKDAEAAITATEIEVSRHLYVGNLHYMATKDEVGEVFSTAGIKVVRVSMPPGDGNRNRGYTFIEVQDGQAAMRALEAPNLHLRGRPLIVNEAAPPQAGRRPQTVDRHAGSTDLSERLYIGNLPYTATEATVRELFRGHEFRPLEIYISLDRASGRSRGFGFVSMASERDAAQAIGALNGTIVDGRAIEVRPAMPRRQGEQDEQEG